MSTLKNRGLPTRPNQAKFFIRVCVFALKPMEKFRDLNMSINAPGDQIKLQS